MDLPSSREGMTPRQMFLLPECLLMKSLSGQVGDAGTIGLDEESYTGTLSPPSPSSLSPLAISQQPGGSSFSPLSNQAVPPSFPLHGYFTQR